MDDLTYEDVQRLKELEEIQSKERPFASEIMVNRIDVLSEILDTVWVVICVVMIILSQVGFMMKETGSIKMR